MGKTQRVWEKLNGYLSLLSELLRISANQGRKGSFGRCSQAEVSRGSSREELRQKCREGPCTTFRSRTRLYMEAVGMAKPRRRDVMGKENDSTSYERSEVRCAFVFFFFSPSRGQIFGLSAQRERYAHTVPTAHGVARLFARRRGAGERLSARQVEQKKPVRRSTCK